MLAVQPFPHRITNGFRKPSIPTLLFPFVRLVFSSKLTPKALDARFQAAVQELGEPA